MNSYAATLRTTNGVRYGTVWYYCSLQLRSAVQVAAVLCGQAAALVEETHVTVFNSTFWPIEKLVIWLIRRDGKSLQGNAISAACTSFTRTL